MYKKRSPNIQKNGIQQINGELKKLSPRQKINQVRSTGHRLKIFTTSPLPEKKQAASIQRPITINTKPQQISKKAQKKPYNILSNNNFLRNQYSTWEQNQRLQRLTDLSIRLKNRQQNLRYNDRSLNQIRLANSQSKDHSYNGSESGSTKKRTGIELTKTLLKRISGMYSDKDFQNRSFLNKSKKQQTTGIMTMTMSGQKIFDQYQISQYDFLGHGNHTINESIHKNPLSSNDSGNWKESSYLPKNYSNQIRGNFQIQNLSNNRTNNSKHQKLIKAVSFDLLNLKPTTKSIVVKNTKQHTHLKPSPRREQHQFSRQQFQNQNQNQKYLIQSKNKTLDEMSVKQSMIVGFDNYYQ